MPTLGWAGSSRQLLQHDGISEVFWAKEETAGKEVTGSSHARQ